MKQTAQIIGKLGRDPELRYTKTQMAALTLSVAASPWRKKEDGTWGGVTTWWNVTVFGKQAESLQKRVKKGTLIEASGNATFSAYTKKDGGVGVRCEIVAQDVTVLSWDQAQTTEANLDFSQATQTQTLTDEDVPF